MPSRTLQAAVLHLFCSLAFSVYLVSSQVWNSSVTQLHSCILNTDSIGPLHLYCPAVREVHEIYSRRSTLSVRLGCQRFFLSLISNKWHGHLVELLATDDASMGLTPRVSPALAVHLCHLPRFVSALCWRFAPNSTDPENQNLNENHCQALQTKWRTQLADLEACCS